MVAPYTDVNLHSLIIENFKQKHFVYMYLTLNELAVLLGSRGFEYIFKICIHKIKVAAMN